MKKVLIVCAGNLCRSPMALAVARAMWPPRARGMEFDAAGTHVARGGDRPDPRACAALQRRGYAAPMQRSRRVRERDFVAHDLILAMDHHNLAALRSQCPAQHQGKLRLFLDFAPPLQGTDVPDPYWGNAQGFERVLDLCETGLQGLMRALPA